MIPKLLISVFLVLGLLSCSRDKNEEGTYFVNASKLIEISGSNWANTEPKIKNKSGYNYSTSPASTGIKAVINLPAVDDSNRVVNGKLLLNLSNDNKVQATVFDTDPISQSAAFAMMLNYNHQTLKILTDTISSVGTLVDNGAGSNVPVSTALSNLTSGRTIDQIGIIYTTMHGRFTMAIFKQPDGRYLFRYTGF
jgi:hypothetical protein